MSHGTSGNATGKSVRVQDRRHKACAREIYSQQTVTVTSYLACSHSSAFLVIEFKNESLQQYFEMAVL